MHALDIQTSKEDRVARFEWRNVIKEKKKTHKMAETRGRGHLNAFPDIRGRWFRGARCGGSGSSIMEACT